MFCRCKQIVRRKRHFVVANRTDGAHLYLWPVVLESRQRPGKIALRELLNRKLFLRNLPLHHLFAWSLFITETNKCFSFCQSSIAYEKEQTGHFLRRFDCLKLHLPLPSRRSKVLTAIGSAAFSLLTSLFQGCHNSEDAPKQIIKFDCNLPMQLKFRIFDRMTITSMYFTFLTTRIVKMRF